MTESVNLLEKLPDPPVLDLDPYSEESLLDPYPFHEALREAGPVVWLSKYNVYAVGRHKDVKTVMNDYDRFSSVAGIGLVDRRQPGLEKFRTTSPMTEEDPPLHTSTRAGVQKILSPILVRSWRERFEQHAEVLANRIMERDGPVNAVKDIAEEFVTTVGPESLGLDVPKEYLPAIGEMNFFSLGPPNDRQRAAYERVQHAIDWYEKSVLRENVKPGTFGDMIYQQEDAGVFREGVGIGLIRTFIRGGTDTTVAAISSTLLNLAQHPEYYARVRNDVALLRNAFEETIRHDTPPQTLHRLVTRDMDFEGFRLKGDIKIAFFPGAANRDPRRWENPDVFDLDRDVLGQHLGFGSGHHVCIGQNIARLEAETVLHAIVKRTARLELAGEPVWRAVSAIRSLKELPIRLIPA